MPTSRTRTVVVSERARWPRISGAPHPQLRGLLARDYGGWTEATTPFHDFVAPATAAVGIVISLKLRDSPGRPGVLAGAHNTFLGGLGGAPAHSSTWSCG